MINAGMMSSKTDKWETPVSFFEKLNHEFNFQTDVCATAENTKCKKFYSPEENGLMQQWRGVCWMNPPYGREIGKWVEKAYLAALGEGCTVVCLLPSRTDTKWFQDFCMKSKDIRFIRGRLHFGESKNGAPFPSVVVIFSPKTLKAV